jgi:hypothetical protein
MPNEGPMAQVSRPYQIALAVLALFAAVWFLALHRPGSGSSSGSSGSSASSSPSTATKATQPTAGTTGTPGASTPIYHGSAPGVEGLTRAIDRAHGAVATSEQNAQQLQRNSTQASESAPAGAGAAPATAASVPAATAPSQTSAATASAHGVVKATRGAVKTSSTHAKATQSQASATALASAQTTALQSELAHGQTVLLLFWNPKSTDDAAVHREAQSVASHSKGKVVLHVALANQVGQYGAVTRGVQVFQTPTLLLVDKHGLAVTLTGLQDKYSIEQGIREAQAAAR